MKKFIVEYTPKNRNGERIFGETERVWVHADSKEDAISQVESEYWNIYEIDRAYEAKF